MNVSYIEIILGRQQLILDSNAIILSGQKIISCASSSLREDALLYIQRSKAATFSDFEIIANIE